MSRNSVVVACALLALVGLIMGDRLGAQQAEDPFGAAGGRNARPSRSPVQSAEDRIESVLNEQLKAPVDFLETPLRDVLDQLQDEYEIPIVFDSSALDEVAVNPDQEVSASLSNIRLRSALDLMLKQPGLEDLTYIVDKEVLLITTEDRANDTLITKVYRVDDFDHSPRNSSSDPKDNCYSPLRSVIVSCVEYGSWQENGTGEGQLDLMKPGMLIVIQTRAVHRKIEELLADLRKVKGEIETESSGSSF